MQDDDHDELNNLKNLSKTLRKLESNAPYEVSRADLRAVHDELMTAIRNVGKCNFRLGCILLKFKKVLKDLQIWTEVVNQIAKEMGCAAVTLTRLVDSCERNARLTPMTVDALLASQINPSSPANRELMDTIAGQPAPTSPEAAQAAVAIAYDNHVAGKRAIRDSKRNAAKDPDDAFPRQAVKLFKSHFGSVHDAASVDEIRYVLEKIVNSLGVDIRELRIYSRPDLVPKPAREKAA